jgi:hypothetical protein
MSSKTDHLINCFAAALREKLNAAERKYGYSDDWLKGGWQDELIEKLLGHVEKGDPRDVAAYCAFAWHHGWSISPQGLSIRRAAPEAPSDAVVERVARAIADAFQKAARTDYGAACDAAARAAVAALRARTGSPEADPERAGTRAPCGRHKRLRRQTGGK